MVNMYKQKKTQKKEITLIGTWNFRGLFGEGNTKHLMMEFSKYEFDIAALQETKKLGQQVSEIEEYLFSTVGVRTEC